MSSNDIVSLSVGALLLQKKSKDILVETTFGFNTYLILTPAVRLTSRIRQLDIEDCADAFNENLIKLSSLILKNFEIVKQRENKR